MRARLRASSIGDAAETLPFGIEFDGDIAIEGRDPTRDTPSRTRLLRSIRKGRCGASGARRRIRSSRRQGSTRHPIPPELMRGHNRCQPPHLFHERCLVGTRITGVALDLLPVDAGDPSETAAPNAMSHASSGVSFNAHLREQGEGARDSRPHAPPKSTVYPAARLSPHNRGRAPPARRRARGHGSRSRCSANVVAAQHLTPHRLFQRRWVAGGFFRTTVAARAGRVIARRTASREPIAQRLTHVARRMRVRAEG